MEKKKKRFSKGRTQVRLIQINPTSDPFTPTPTVMVGSPVFHKDKLDESMSSTLSTTNTGTDNQSNVPSSHNKAGLSILPRSSKARNQKKDKGHRSHRTTTFPFKGSPIITTSVDEELTIPNDDIQGYRILIPNQSSTNSSQARDSWRAETRLSGLTDDTTTNEKWANENGMEHDTNLRSENGCLGVSDEQWALVLATVAGCAIFLV